MTSKASIFNLFVCSSSACKHAPHAQYSLLWFRRVVAKGPTCWGNKLSNTTWEIYRIDQSYVFLLFLPASRPRDYFHSICFEDQRYSGVFICPELRCGIQTCLGTIRFWCVETKEFARPPNFRKPTLPIGTKKTRNTMQHQISAWDDFSGPVSCPKTCLCSEPLVQLQNTKVLLN